MIDVKSNFRIYFLLEGETKLKIILKNGFATFAPGTEKIEAEGRKELPLNVIYKQFGLNNECLDDDDKRFIYEAFVETFSLKTFDKRISFNLIFHTLTALTKSDFYRYDKNPIRQQKIVEEGYSRRFIGNVFVIPTLSSYRKYMKISSNAFAPKSIRQNNCSEMLSIQPLYLRCVECSVYSR